jgi:formate-dependent nitrite reductase membrane component NrfD
LKRDSAVSFYIGVIAIGILAPLIITLVIWGNGVEKMSGGVLLLRFLCVLIGDLVMRYNIMKSALYAPVI